MLSTSVTAMESSLHPPAHQCSAWCMKERKQAGKTDVASHGKQRSRRNNISRGGGISMCPLISTSPRYSIQTPLHKIPSRSCARRKDCWAGELHARRREEKEELCAPAGRGVAASSWSRLNRIRTLPLPLPLPAVI